NLAGRPESPDVSFVPSTDPSGRAMRGKDNSAALSQQDGQSATSIVRGVRTPSWQSRYTAIHPHSRTLQVVHWEFAKAMRQVANASASAIHVRNLGMVPNPCPRGDHATRGVDDLHSNLHRNEPHKGEVVPAAAADMLPL